MRIASFLPSATEIICEMGLADSLVAISHCCDYPQEIVSRPVVTSSVIDAAARSDAIDLQVRKHLTDNKALYAIDTDKLRDVGPDVIVTQALCDVCAVNGEDVAACIDALAKEPRIVNLEPFSLEDVILTIRAIGEATDSRNSAERLIRTLRTRIDTVVNRVKRHQSRKSVALLDWVDPPFASGHWMTDLIELAGGANIIDLGSSPSTRIEWQQIESARPDILVIACCGFDLTRSLRELSQSAILSRLERIDQLGCEIHIVDGNGYFSRPGPRLVDSLELLAWILDGCSDSGPLDTRRIHCSFSELRKRSAEL